MIQIRPVTRDDIRHVVYRMWQRGCDELEKNDHLYEREKLVGIFIHCAKEYGFSFLFNGEPIAVTGALRISEKEYHTWFTATDKFALVGRELTRFLRKLTVEGMGSHPDTQLIAHSASDHPDVDRWFKLLGFLPIEPQDGFKRFLYTAKKD